MEIKRVIIIILDSVGVGETADSYMYNDKGVNTLLHISERYPGAFPNMELLGFGNLLPPGSGMRKEKFPLASFGRAKEQSAGKDSTSGHWEVAGLIKKDPFPVYPAGFPERILKDFKTQIKTDILGNYPASGTEILDALGEEHMKTGYPIVYTSGDSVFQIAAHEDVVPLKTLYHWCEIARRILRGKDLMGRVIARPFIGEKKGEFKRTSNRRDFSAVPPENTVLDNAKIKGMQVLGIGKTEDLFAGKGLTSALHGASNKENIMLTVNAIKKNLKGTENVEQGIIFTNLVDFDTKYGHRRDVAGYYSALREFDEHIPLLIGSMKKDDVLILTADHGNDPTYTGSDHTREFVPVVVYGSMLRRGVDLGELGSFADIGRTASEMLSLNPTKNGKGFLKNIMPEAVKGDISVSGVDIDIFLFDPGIYRQDIYSMCRRLADAGNRVDYLLSDFLMGCSFDTGECLLSTVPANRKDKYGMIVVPLTEDHIPGLLDGFDSEDTLARELERETGKGKIPLCVYPSEYLEGTRSYEVLRKRRWMLARLMEKGYKVMSISSFANEFNRTIKRSGT